MRPEDRIKNVFDKLDNYIEKRSFEELTIRLVSYLLDYFDMVSEQTKKFGGDELLDELAVELKWLKEYMDKEGLKRVVRDEEDHIS